MSRAKFKFSIQNLTNLGVENLITSFYEMQKLALSWLAKSNGQLLNPNETRTNLFISRNMKKHEKMTKINKNQKSTLVIDIINLIFRMQTFLEMSFSDASAIQRHL